MLVLSRKNGESIRIGEDIEIQVLKSKTGRVQLGIKAPMEVRVQRTELLDILRLHNQPVSPPEATGQELASAAS